MERRWLNGARRLTPEIRRERARRYFEVYKKTNSFTSAAKELGTNMNTVTAALLNSGIPEIVGYVQKYGRKNTPNKFSSHLPQVKDAPVSNKPCLKCRVNLSLVGENVCALCLDPMQKYVSIAGRPDNCQNCGVMFTEKHETSRNWSNDLKEWVCRRCFRGTPTFKEKQKLWQVAQRKRNFKRKAEAIIKRKEKQLS